MSLWDKLPTDIIQHIYEYDSTYREKINESLKFIEHACPTCCCDGGKKTRYRHYGDLEDAFWNWEWRRRNACPKHNPSEFDKITRNDALYQYMVYLPELNMTNRFTSRHNKTNMTKQKFKIYVFTDQVSLKRKIRVELQ